MGTLPMNKTINALTTKLKWQRHELSNKMLKIEHNIIILEQNMDSILQKISNSCTMPALILPEQEIARSHFMTQQHQHQHELINKKIDLLANLDELKNQQTRLNMELKMLEKHQEALLNKQRQRVWKMAQNNSDEWALQRGEHQ